MAEIIVPIVAEQVGAPAACWIKRQISFVFNFKRNVDNFKQQLHTLKHKRERIDVATEVIEGDVEDWQQRVKTFEEKAEVFLEETEMAKKGCFFGFCPNVKARYQASKKAEKESKAAADLLSPGECPRVLCRPLPKGLPFAPVKDYETFESRARHFKEIMEALKNPNVSMIGVWGMGGVGKTTLVKKAAEKANVDGVFDVVIFSEVSLNQGLGRIQGEIADALGLKFKAETISGRSKDLRECFLLHLQKEKKILVILDNIWAVNNKMESLDLGDLGIPSGDDRKGCKILMTSRDMEVFTRMDTNNLNIKVDALDEEEAWNLFEKMAGDVVKAGNLQPLPVEIAKKCAGLPIFITTVASTLRNIYDLHIWKEALQQLEKFENDDFDARAYSTIELSYNHLQNNVIKQLFLLCGQLVNTDYAIEDLLKYCMSIDSFKDIDRLEDRRNKLHNLVRNLKSKCLLLDGEENGYVKMHDVVRMFAKSYARQKHNMFTEKYDDELEEWPRRNTVTKFSSIYFSRNYIHRLLGGLECPELKLFILHSKNRYLKIPSSFFQGLGGIIVLDIKNIVLPSLPSSFRCLENLRTLSLEECQLEDTTMIGELVGLEVLCFVNTNISSLPEEIRQLTGLKLLCVNRCIKLEVIPRNVISSLTQLEELSMERSFVNWEAEGDNCQNACLAELKKLSKLVSLNIHIPNALLMPNDLFSVKLERFKILIGDGWDWHWSSEYETSRRLKLKLSTRNHLKRDVKELLKKTEDLYLDELGGVNSVCELDKEGSFPGLRCLHIRWGSNFQYIVNSNTRVPSVFSNLEVLSLTKLINLEMICLGQLGVESFSKLRIVKVKRCDKLKNLFSFAIAKSQLMQLQQIKVKNCENIEEIFSCESENDGKCDIVIELKQVHSLCLKFLPKITSFCSEVKLQTRDSSESSQNVQLIPLLNGKILFPNLEKLVLYSIGAEKIWDNSLLAMPRCFKALRDLEVWGCNKLKFLFPVGVVTSLIQLKKLWVKDCELMEGIIEGGTGSMIFHKLCRLDLQVLPKLKRFCTGNSIEFPSLSHMRIEGCPELKSFIFDEKEVSNDDLSPPLFDEKEIFPNSVLAMPCCFEALRDLEVQGCNKLKFLFPVGVVTSLIQLNELMVEGCELMEGIIEGGTCSMIFHKLRRLDLDALPKLKRFCTGNSIEFPSLSYMRINECPELKSFIFDEKEVSNDDLLPPLFDEKIQFPNLENLVLSSIGAEKIWDNSLLAMSHCFEALRDLEVQGCNKLKFLFPVCVVTSLIQLNELTVEGCELMEGIIEGGIGSMIFHKLCRLDLDALPKLKRFCTGNSIKFPSLSEMWINKCPELKSFIFDEKEVSNDDLLPPLFDEKIQFPNLEDLVLSSFGVEKIWDNSLLAMSRCFEALRDLEVQRCNKLKFLFPVCVVTSLIQLNELKVEGCELMEGIIEGGIGSMIFPKLESLYLQDLPKLKRFCTGNSIKFPSLSYMRINKCPELKSFIFDEKEVSNDDLPTPLFDEKVELPTIERLFIWSVNLKRIWHDELAPESFCKLDDLDLLDCENLSNVFPSNMLTRLQNLQKLRIDDCKSMDVIFDLEGPSALEIHITKLKSLRIRGCPSLKIFASQCRNVQKGANGEYLFLHETHDAAAAAGDEDFSSEEGDGGSDDDEEYEDDDEEGEDDAEEDGDEKEDED